MAAAGVVEDLAAEGSEADLVVAAGAEDLADSAVEAQAAEARSAVIRKRDQDGSGKTDC
jgi:hypothetical protein